MTKQWIPAEYLDEGPCDLRDSPDAWLAAISDGAICLDTPSTWTGGDAEAARITMVDGVVVPFLYYEEIDTATLTLAENGDWTVDTAMPTQANGVAAMDGWQHETAAGNLEEVVDALVSLGAEPGEYPISYYFWSEQIALHYVARLRTFVQVDGETEGGIA